MNDNAEDPELEGRSLSAWIDDLNAKQGATRLRAITALHTAEPSIVLKVLGLLAGDGRQRIHSPWAEELLQTLYARHWASAREDLQEAYFNYEGAVKRTLFEIHGADSLTFLTMCLNAGHWQVREDSALAMIGLGIEATPALTELESAARAEENEEAQRTMQTAIQKIRSFG